MAFHGEPVTHHMHAGTHFAGGASGRAAGPVPNNMSLNVPFSASLSWLAYVCVYMSALQIGNCVLMVLKRK